MIQVEPIQNFNGFGSGGGQGEYYHSQGMTASLFGIIPGWVMTTAIDSSSLSTLGVGQWFTEGVLGGNTYVFSFGSNNNIVQSLNGTGTPTLAYKPGVSGAGNGMIVDQKNRLLYAMERYLGMYDGSANYTTGTIAVTNGSNAVVGSGTTFTSAMVDRRIVIGGIWYTISVFTDATHITLSSNYAGSTASGLSYSIYTGWNDKFKDFGASISPTTALRPMDTYEDWVMIGNQNQIALLNVTDDSFNTNALNLPSGLLIRCGKSGRTGILIGANFNSRGVLILWDAFSTRSIAPWIWLNGTIKSIVPVADSTGGWIVITSRNIYITNGYSIQRLIPKLPDFPLTTASLTENLLPQGAELIENNLIFWGFARANRLKAGLYILNLNTNLFEFVPASNGVLYNLTSGAIFFDSNNHIHTAYSTLHPSATYIGKLTAGSPGQASYVSGELGLQTDNEKVAEGVKFSFGLDTREIETYALTFNATVKIYNFKRSLWNYAQTNNASTQAGILRVNGDIKSYTAKVGDEVTVLEGVNAGLIRHITAIANPGINTEQWTLDSVLPSNTESSILLSVTPFRKVRTFTLSSLAELTELFFDIQDRIKGKKFLVKLQLDGLGNLTPEIKSGQFIYNDLSLKR
jgi:hypothetical protein